MNTNPASTNIWQAAYNFGNLFETDLRTKTYGFSIVGYEGNDAQFFGSFCAKDYAYFPFIGSGNWGRVFIIQTR